MLVYFAQLTTVNNEQLTEQAANLLEMGKCGLIFNYDLLGYGIMALSTFFTGLSMKAKNKTDKWLKALMMIHGVFYFSCTFMPITGMFLKMTSGGDGIGGRLALVAWCVYFLPIGILSFLHYRKDESFAELPFRYSFDCIFYTTGLLTTRKTRVIIHPRLRNVVLRVQLPPAVPYG